MLVYAGLWWFCGSWLFPSKAFLISRSSLTSAVISLFVQPKGTSQLESCVCSFRLLMGLTYTDNKEAHYVIAAAGLLFEATHKGLGNSTMSVP